MRIAQNSLYIAICIVEKWSNDPLGPPTQCLPYLTLERPVNMGKINWLYWMAWLLHISLWVSSELCQLCCWHSSEEPLGACPSWDRGSGSGVCWLHFTSHWSPPLSCSPPAGLYYCLQYSVLHCQWAAEGLSRERGHLCTSISPSMYAIWRHILGLLERRDLSVISIPGSSFNWYESNWNLHFKKCS